MPPLKERRKERLAVNLFDIDSLEPTMRLFLISGKIDFKLPVRVGESIQETAVPFQCRLLEAATACDIIQEEQRKVGLPPVKVYLDAEGTGFWIRIASSTQFTVVHGGKVALNPEVFGKETLKQSVKVEAKRLF